MSADDASSDLWQRRRRRLIRELADESVDLQVPHTDPVFSVLVDEITYARYLPVHEGRRSSYGVLVVDRPDQVAAFTEVAAFIDGSGAEPGTRNLEQIRKMCNGLTTFLVRSPRGPETLLELKLQADEQRLAQLISPEVRVVQRTRDDAVKVFAPEHVYVFEHDEWRSKVYAADAATKLKRIFFPKGPDPVLAHLTDLLALCLHRLSSRHIGATFVWFPHPDRLPVVVQHEDWGNVPSVPLFVGHPHQMEAIATLLASIDGACIVGPTGEIERIETKLAPTGRAMSLIAAESGLRHTAAKRYSYDEPNCIVFVVSHDGPVTVYSDGMSVLQLRTGPTYVSSIDGVAQHDWFGSYRPRSCPKCGKELVVERLHTRDQVVPMTIECPICRYDELESDNAVAMHAWPGKPWTRWGVNAWLPDE